MIRLSEVHDALVLDTDLATFAFPPLGIAVYYDEDGWQTFMAIPAPKHGIPPLAWDRRSYRATAGLRDAPEELDRDVREHNIDPFSSWLGMFRVHLVYSLRHFEEQGDAESAERYRKRLLDVQAAGRMRPAI